jgi:hypothetical protein
MIFVRKATIYAKTALRKDAPKQANYEELAYDEKTTIYTKTAFREKDIFTEFLFDYLIPKLPFIA